MASEGKIIVGKDIVTHMNGLKELANFRRLLKCLVTDKPSTTNADPPVMVEASKLVHVAHEIAHQVRKVRLRLAPQALKIMKTLWEIILTKGNRLDEIEDLGPGGLAADLMVAATNLNDFLNEKALGLQRLMELKHELLEAVPYCNDGTSIRKLPWFSSSRGPYFRHRGDLIASRDKKNFSCTSINILEQRDMIHRVGTTNMNHVWMVKASRVNDVVNDIAYQVIVQLKYETEAFAACQTMWDVILKIDKLEHPRLAPQVKSLKSGTTKVWNIMKENRDQLPGLWDVTQELLDLVPDSNDKTSAKIAECDTHLRKTCSIHPMLFNSRPYFDPLRLIKSRDMKKSAPEVKCQGDLVRLLHNYHDRGNYVNLEPHSKLYFDALLRVQALALTLSGGIESSADNVDESSDDRTTRKPVHITAQERCYKSLKVD